MRQINYIKLGDKFQFANLPFERGEIPFSKGFFYLYGYDITFGSNKKVWWRGACGHEWQTTHPKIASEWSEKNLPLKSDEVNAKSRK